MKPKPISEVELDQKILSLDTIVELAEDLRLRLEQLEITNANAASREAAIAMVDAIINQAKRS